MGLLAMSPFFVKYLRSSHFKRLTVVTSVLVLSLGLSTPAESDLEKPNQRPWVMHHISDEYLIANSLFPGDVNKDGCLDYSVIDEAAGTQTILFHPGKSGDVRQPWFRLVLGKTNNPEYSCLADLDGDGNLDLVVVEGDDNEKGFKTGLRILFGPEVENMKDASKWKDAGHVPGTEGEQYLYCVPVDINDDGITEVVFGGRRHPVTKKYAGLRWLQVPQEAEKRRDLSQYKVYFIDPEVTSAHGFVPSDIDEDGDIDILDANPDWDTSLFDQEVYWYENPGADSPDLYKPWKKHSIWKTTQFYPKPQTGLGDVNKDGHEDIVT
ncbi:MAG TPA: VCBS repeat-containing protein [Candidatus Hydrogenedentes bacterium]|nr:VCBS repeat-containing protein [Candidatus Hydrogenedentota bacterium]HOL77438.1 VCBS repeat-containing protein [Candidatus Hydrogenedentota bacterium]